MTTITLDESARAELVGLFASGITHTECDRHEISRAVLIFISAINGRRGPMEIDVRQEVPQKPEQANAHVAAYASHLIFGP